MWSVSGIQRLKKNKSNQSCSKLVFCSVGWKQKYPCGSISTVLPRKHRHLELSSWGWSAVAAAKLLQSCPTLYDPTDGSPPGSPVPGILQARTLEWAAISFSNAWKWNVKVKSLSHVWLLATPWTAAHQAPPPMGFSRQEYWSGLPLPSPWGWFRPSHLLVFHLTVSAFLPGTP